MGALILGGAGAVHNNGNYTGSMEEQAGLTLQNLASWSVT